MDDDLKQVLELMRHENAAGHEETRRLLIAGDEETRRLMAAGDEAISRQLSDAVETLTAADEAIRRQLTEAVVTLTAADEAIRQQLTEAVETLTASDDSIRRQLTEAVEALTAADAEARRHVDLGLEDNRRHFGVLAEGLQVKIEAVAEVVAMNGEKLDRLETRVEHLASNMDHRITRLEAASSRRQ